MPGILKNRSECSPKYAAAFEEQTGPMAYPMVPKPRNTPIYFVSLGLL